MSRIMKPAVLQALLLITSFGFSILTVSADLSVRPSNAVSIVRGSAHFNCSTTNPMQEIQWFHYPVGSRERNIVYGYATFKMPYVGRFLMQQNSVTGAYNLVISPVIEQDAGTYECQDDGGHGKKSKAELTVLVTNPVCTSNISSGVIFGPNSCGLHPDVLQLSCSAEFRGNVAPVLEWTRLSDNSPVTEGVTMNSSSQHVSYNLTQEIHAGIDGESYVCQTKKHSSTEQQYSCISEVIRVWRASNNYSLVQKTTGERVQCASDIDQSMCNFQWTRIDQKGEAVVSTDQSMKPVSTGLYRCQMDCNIRRMNCTISAMLVHVRSTESDALLQAEQFVANTSPDVEDSQSFKGAFIAVLVILCVSTISVVAVLYFLIRRRKSKPYVYNCQS